MYVKYKSYHFKRFGNTIAVIICKVNPLNLKLKATITMQDGRIFELLNQWDSEEEFDIEIENFVRSKQ